MKISIEQNKLMELMDYSFNFITELNIVLNEKGLEVKSMDPANVMMLVTKIPKANFIEYEIEGDCKWVVNVKDFKDILKRLKNDIIVISELENRLHITQGSKKYTLPLINDEIYIPKIPELNFKVKFDIESKNLLDGILDAKIIAEAVTFKAKDKLTLAASGDKSKFSDELQISKQVVEDEDNTSKYAVEYLEKILKINKFVPILTVGFAKDYPLSLSGKTKTLEEYSVILAPRVETD